MAEVVFILGAGASRECGAPLMANFLDVAEDLQLHGKTGDDSGHFACVFASIAALKSVQAQLALDTYNLETVFSAFEMGAMIGRLGTIDQPEEIAATRRAMTRLITRTLQETVLFRLEKRRLAPANVYSKFISLLMKARDPSKVRRPVQSAIITLNYDLAADFALHWHNIAYSYGLDDRPIGPSEISLLKLHGSLNWGNCPKCSNVVIPYLLRTYFQKYDFRSSPFDDGPVDVSFNLGDHLQDLTHDECATNLSNEPVVVPPTWNKSDNRLLGNVWRHAANELSQARYLVLVGYSFPPTDLYFQYLLGLGLAADTRIRRIVVINPDPLARDRLDAQLSPVMRTRVRYVNVGFEAGLGALDELLDLKPT